jgi:hypothetical protein
LDFRRFIKLTLFAVLIMRPAQPAQAQHQTTTVTPLTPSDASDFQISVRQYDFGNAPIAGLHSFAYGVADGKWVILSGRTNGVHEIDQAGTGSFPEESQNRDVWVVDPIAKQTWHRSLGQANATDVDPVSGLSPLQVASLAATNNEFQQVGNTLYVAGGYGLNTTGEFETFNKLSAINLPGLVDWVTTGTGTAAANIRQIDTPTASVTGGAMYAINGRTHLVFGQDFDGAYSPRADGAYTRQVRSFDIYDNGTYLAISNYSQTPQVADYRRRDLNVFPVLSADGNGGVKQGLVALSGVFTSGFGVWTVPVTINESGVPTMADPNADSTFKQGFNNYHSAKLGLYSESQQQMSEVLFGGISLQSRDPISGQVTTDDGLPFVNDITAVSINAAGEFSQRHLGYFPTIIDQAGNAWRFGANGEFFLAPGINTFSNGVINADSLSNETVLGYLFGGIMTNGPHTRGFPNVTSTASNFFFEVVYTPVPEIHTPYTIAFGTWACLRLAGGKRSQLGSRGRELV